MTKTIDIDVLGSGEPYHFEPPVLEEKSYTSNDSFDGLKRERMIHFLNGCYESDDISSK